MWMWLKIEIHSYYEYINTHQRLLESDWVKTMAALYTPNLLAMAYIVKLLLWWQCLIYSTVLTDTYNRIIHIHTCTHARTHAHNTHTHTHTHTHTPSGVVAGDVHRYLDLILAARVSMLSCSRALAISFHDATIVVSSQYCNVSSLHLSTPSFVCVDWILFNWDTGTLRYAPSKNQLSTSLSSSNSTATVSSGVSTHRIRENSNIFIDV